MTDSTLNDDAVFENLRACLAKVFENKPTLSQAERAQRLIPSGLRLVVRMPTDDRPVARLSWRDPAGNRTLGFLLPLVDDSEHASSMQAR